MLRSKSFATSTARLRRAASQAASLEAADRPAAAVLDAVPSQPAAAAAAVEASRRGVQTVGFRAPHERPENELKLLLRQVKRERDLVTVATSEYRKLNEKFAAAKPSFMHRTDGRILPSVRTLMCRWFPRLTEAFEAEKALINEQKLPKGASRSSYEFYLDVVSAEKLAVITLHGVLGQLVRGTSRLGDVHVPEFKTPSHPLAQSIGKAVQDEVNLAKLDKEAEDMPFPPGRKKSAPRVTLGRLLRARETFKDAQWTVEMRDKIGGLLIKLLMETAMWSMPGKAPGSFEEVPAFKASKIFDPKTKRSHGAIEWLPKVQQALQRSNEFREGLHPRSAPMLVPPRPWTAHDKGGHLLLDSLVMRGAYGPLGPAKGQLGALQEEERRMLEGQPGRGFQPVLDALNVLGRTRWCINKRVLEVMEDVWEKGGGIAGIPDRKDVELPLFIFGVRSTGLQLVCNKASPRDMLDVRGIQKMLVKKTQQHNRELHSLRCDFQLKLRVAQDNRHEAAIYFPHNIDFRGRAYTIHPHLNHLGADTSRGLLMFADARPLGASGLKWLRIQVANLFAGVDSSGARVDKQSHADRERWTVANMHHVSDSALNPLGGPRWWQQADDPWQCLAACMELQAAEQSGDPFNFLSSLPVHQDGSCNGLQHYAALARDEVGGRSVNLLPRDSPEDVYTGIADLVRSAVEKDMSGDPKTASLAQSVLQEIDRKLVKQTVMTSVYGVTFIGARDQILNRLRERRAFDDPVDSKAAATYAARKVLDGLENMFENANAVMEWLNDCARDIAHSEAPVEWRTPVGLPVVQPYRKPLKKIVLTALQIFTVTNQSSNAQPVVKSKQRTAFPPNFIHSLDSAHMMLTACACDARGIVFAGVHDSFWTHAGSVEDLSVILRECFVDLHSRPLLQELYDSFKAKYPDVNFREPPPLGDLRLEDVRFSPYFFS